MHLRQLAPRAQPPPGRLVLRPRPLAAARVARTVDATISAETAHKLSAPVLSDMRMPPVVNWFVTPVCNYRCKFCFATFKDFDHAEVVDDTELLMQVPMLLRDAGASRITFVGGEPFLHPLIEPLLAECKAQGLITAVVTNGRLLDTQRLEKLAPVLDWLALSIDASSDAMHALIGRGRPGEVVPLTASAGGGAPQAATRNGHLAHAIQLWHTARRLGMRLKLNTVVTRANLQDDGMASLVGELRPERWKVFQVMPVEGQNSGHVEPLLISADEFQEWVDKNRQQVEPLGVPLVAESNSEMRGTYAMLDARCRFFSSNSDAHTGHVYGRSIFEAGSVQAAWQDMAPMFDASTFKARGGLYDWGQGDTELARQQHSW